MIISAEKKIVVFMVPRTGTNTLRTLFESTGIPLAACDDYHYNVLDIPSVMDELGITNYNEFRYYSFYRNPFERCLSVVNFLRRGRQGSKFFHAFYGDDVIFPVSCASRVPYPEWSDEMKAMCDSVPLIEVFRKFKYFFERNIYGKTHKPWLGGPVQPMNFADYENELSRLLVEFGVDPSTVTIPHVNPSLTLPEFDHLSASEEAEIREYLQEDYDFLASKGIRFS